MDKLILKRIAKRWCKGMLKTNAIDSETADELLSQEEQDFIVSECCKIADRITDLEETDNLDETIKEYYEINPEQK